ncbi:MAG: hypothetical protein Q7V88_15715 [Actinomycetota bacterium]|nr:hypothetical protein [Actinomycetota bacterium]
MKIRSDRSQLIDERDHLVSQAPIAQAPLAQPQNVQPQYVQPTQAVDGAQALDGGGFAPPPPVVVAPMAETPVGSEMVVTSRSSGFTPSALVAGIVAIGLLLLGGITAARAGLDSPLDEPVVQVAGYSATALLGLFEMAFGMLLLIAALSRSRQTVLFLGIAGGVAALVAVFQPSVGDDLLAVERGFAVIVAIAMGAIVLAALLPTVRRSSLVQRTSDVN